MEHSYLIIADDFTGANDTGVQMRKRGIATDVVLFPDASAGGGSAVLDTESRNIPAQQAYEKVSTLAGALLKANTYDLVYKKVDSTLRGNIAAEVKAVLAHYPADCIVFAPAFPEIGRTTAGGIHHLKGVPLMQTEMARDPAHPLHTDSINDLMADIRPDYSWHSLEELRSGGIRLQPGAHTFDAQTPEDTLLIAQLCLNYPGKVLYIGSAGLADKLFDQLVPKRPALAVIGSISAVSMEQTAHAESEGTRILALKPADTLNNTGMADYLTRAQEILAQGKDLVIATTRSRADYDESLLLANAQGVSRGELAVRVQEYLGQLIGELLGRVTVAGVFLTGGDTAISVIRSLGGSGSSIRRELLTGIVLSRLKGGPHEGLSIVTKAGAFGDPAALTYCLRALKEASQ